jgi:hypothetical protein
MARLGAVLCLVLALGLTVARGSTADPGHQPYIVGVVLERLGSKNAAAVDIRWIFQCFPQVSASARYEYTLSLLRIDPERRLRELLRGIDEAGTIRLALSPGRYRVDADPFFCLASIRDSKTQPERGTPFVVPDFCGWTGRVGTTRTSLFPRPGFKEGSVLHEGQTLVVQRRGSANLRHEPDVANDATASDITVRGPARLKNERGACGKGGWRVRLDSGTLGVRAGTNTASHVVATERVEVDGRSAAWRVSATSRRTTVQVVKGVVQIRTRTAVRRLKAGATTSFP